MAFDSKKQPDAQFYSKPTIEILQMLYSKIWRKAFVCARDLGVSQIVPVVVGGGAFTPIEPSQFKTNVYDFVLCCPLYSLLFQLRLESFDDVNTV